MAVKSKLVSVNIAVYNGEKWIRMTLDSIKKQTYKNIEVNILDNNSSDSTAEIITKEYPEFKLIRGKKNIGVWPGQEELLKYSNGEYVAGLTDVVLNRSFIKEAVVVLEKDITIGAVEPKIYQFSSETADDSKSKTKIIDTCGFEIYQNRRIVNIGQGEEDIGQYDEEKEIFAVEGAAPVFRKKALEDCRIGGEIADGQMFWYGDDLDLAWRMRLLGWKEVFGPKVIAWHDRSTAKNVKRKFSDYFLRLKERWSIPIQKRRLDWANVRLSIIKNDQVINILKDLPKIIVREIAVFCYTLFFEPRVFLEIPRFFGLIPIMLKKRQIIMKKSHVSPIEMRKWFK